MGDGQTGHHGRDVKFAMAIVERERKNGEENVIILNQSAARTVAVQQEKKNIVTLLVIHFHIFLTHATLNLHKIFIATEKVSLPKFTHM